MVNDHSMLIHPRNCRRRVYTAGSEVLEATAVGDVSIATEHGDVYLQNVLYVKRLNVNLLSTNPLTDEGACCHGPECTGSMKADWFIW